MTPCAGCRRGSKRFMPLQAARRSHPSICCGRCCSRYCIRCRSERMLMEQLQYNLLFGWFVGLGIDDAVWAPTTFTKNRDRLLDGDIAAAFFEAIVIHADRER